jgi:hypothetical protein
MTCGFAGRYEGFCRDDGFVGLCLLSSALCLHAYQLERLVRGRACDVLTYLGLVRRETGVYGVVTNAISRCCTATFLGVFDDWVSACCLFWGASLRSSIKSLSSRSI